MVPYRGRARAARAHVDGLCRGGRRRVLGRGAAPVLQAGDARARLCTAVIIIASVVDAVVMMPQKLLHSM